MEKRTGQLFFKDGRFYEKVLIGNSYSFWDEKIVDITDEIKTALGLK